MLATGQVIAHYEIEDVAGSGGMGVVYRARDARLGRRVALKVIAPHLARDPVMRQRLNRESAVLAGLDHPNVLPLFEAGEADGVLFLASRWVEGRDLGRLVGEDGPLAVGEAARVVGQVAAALQAAHRTGLIHRDVKPSNVLVAEDGHVYLGDFGLARRSSDASGLTATEQLLGTLDYVSPEQIRGEPIDSRADVYALGGLLHFALTGAAPFMRDGHAAKLYAHLSAEPPAPSAARPDVPGELDAIVARCMAKDPGDRYAAAGGIQKDLQAISAGRSPAVDPTPVTHPREPRAPSPAPSPAAAAAATVRERVEREDGASDGAPGAAVGTPEPVRVDDEDLDARKVTVQARRAAEAGPSTPPHGARTAPAPADGATTGPPRPRRLDPLSDDAAPAAGGEQPRRRRRILPWAIAALVLLAALVPAALLLGLLEEEQAGPQTVKVGESAGGLAIAAGRAWVASPDSGRVVGVPLGDIEGARRSIDVGGEVTGIGSRGDLLAVTAGRRLVRLPGADPSRAERLEVPVEASYVAAGGRTTWLASFRNRALLRVRGDAAGRTRLSSPTNDLALGFGTLWVAHADEGTIGSIDSSSGSPRRLDRVGGRPEALALTRRAVWVADLERNAVLRLDARTGRVDAPIPVGGEPIEIAADDREVWVVRRADDAVTRIDARTGRPLDEIGVAREPVAIALTDDAAWIAGSGGELTRIPR